MQRPKPEDLLEYIHNEESSRGNGKLKIFFGYAAGVGKTYAMLKAAHKLKEEGKDVVCGYIEPHCRPETVQLVEGLEMVLPQQLEYRGLLLKEMDIDAILKRNPQVVLVDEFAHTNGRGCRHSKRYQDVEEILKAGIDVYTTVNVQHIESLCDIVTSITGIIVRERIPDRMFDLAQEVQLVDIEPIELIKRLEIGKVYKEKQAQNALANFFTEEKLTALREIALRRTADRVNYYSVKAKRLSGKEYFTEEKIIVGLSSSPSNAKIIRAASRMAQAFGGAFIGIFVETPTFESMSDEDKERLQSNIHLAEQLGAKIETVCGDDVAFIIAEYARNAGVSKIVVGRSNAKKGLFNRTTFADKLTSYAPNLDIYIIPDNNVEQANKKIWLSSPRKISWKEFAKCFLIILLATIIGIYFYKSGFSEANIITVYILGAFFSGIVTTNRLFSILYAIVCVSAFNLVFTEPRFSLQAYDPRYPITFFITFLAAFISSNIAMKIRRQSKDISKVAYRLKVLLDTNKLLQEEKDVDGIGKIVSLQLAKLLGRDIIFYKVVNQKLCHPVITMAYDHLLTDEKRRQYISENEKAVAAWVYKNRKHAGASTGTLRGAKCYYLSIRNDQEVYGVIGIAMDEEMHLEAFESNLLFAILAEAAAVMERENLRSQQEKATEEANSEKLRANLLRAISHDLRTPLTSISGNADMMIKNELPKEMRDEICTDMYNDAMWLINLVENLLSVTRIEEGVMQIKMQTDMLEDIINESLKHMSRRAIQYHINVKMENEMQLVKVDSRLILQVFINILDNAIKYTPEHGDITISTRSVGDMVRVEIADNGFGISDEEKKRIFDMFYTVNSEIVDSKRSLGMGLALCKSIIQAHDGKIDVIDNYPRGSIFRFTLEKEEIKLHE